MCRTQASVSFPAQAHLIKATQPFERLNLDFKGPLKSNKPEHSGGSGLSIYMSAVHMCVCVCVCVNNLLGEYTMGEYIESSRMNFEGAWELVSK